MGFQSGQHHLLLTLLCGLGFWQSDQLHRVLEYRNVAHELRTLLGVGFVQIIANVHPSIVDSNGEQPKSISNDTIA